MYEQAGFSLADVVVRTVTRADHKIVLASATERRANHFGTLSTAWP
jgi:hypothetical protein